MKSNARMHPPSILAVGDVEHVEFRAAALWLERVDACFVETCAEAATYLETHRAPQWILLFSSQRQAFSQKWIERLHRRAPLAKLVHVCGSWCEGETRTGKALAGVTRVYWHQFAHRAEQAVQRMADYAGWSSPRTATALDFMTQQRLPRRKSDAVVEIIADLRDDYLALAECVAACGMRPVRWAGSHSSGDAALWNGRSLDERGIATLSNLIEQLGGRPLITLLDAPRSHEVAEAMARGGRLILSKPLLLGDLRGALAVCGLYGSMRRAG